MTTAAVNSNQRHKRRSPCLVCGGGDDDPRGQEKRCSGFTNEEAGYVHCSREELAGAIDANGAGLFAHRLQGSCRCGQTHGSSPSSDTRERARDVTYDYRDEHGILLFQVVRKPGKRFLQRKPDGAGGWDWKLGETRRVLYRLLELIAADATKPVYITEGEKDADTLATRGLVSTCNPTGAGKFKVVADSAREVLRGRDVVVVADRDKPGGAHALDVAVRLEGVARSIRIVVAKAPHKDVTDVIEAGGTVDDLVPLVPEPSDDESDSAESSSPETSRVAPKSKADRVLAVLRSMPIHRGPAGVGLIMKERFIALESPAFHDEVQAEWLDRYPDETLPALVIGRACVTLRADKSLPETKVAPPPAPKKPVVEMLEWQLRLVTDEAGNALDCVANVMTVLRKHPDFVGLVRLDLFQQRIILAHRPPFARPDDAPLEWTDTDDTRMQEWVQRELGFEPTRGAIADAIAAVAEDNSFHSVRDYFNRVGSEWDEEERVPTMLANYFGASPNPYTAGVGTAWMISAVARAMRPGCQVDYMIGLESPQGGKKSTGLKALTPQPEWYADTGISIGQKDSYIALHGKLIFCFDEFASIKGSEVTKTKNFLTSTSDSLRPPYGRRNRDFPRQTVFVYTTNERAYLRDRTGNRRLWPVRCNRKVDVEAIERDRDLLWGEAVVRYKRGEKWWPDAALEALCKDEQEERLVADPWAEIVEAWLTKPVEKTVERTPEGNKTVERPVVIASGVTSAQVLTLALGKRPGDITRADEMRLAEVLRELGWDHDTARPRDADGRRSRRWTKRGSNQNTEGRAA